ncbi:MULTISPECIES: tyrosine-type recombinase/integrase [unclassified Microcoleus]|uniref:tyrosine-type recombinase/integrase n=1 Tax=unclassified Microcoleus TaxID=2642155 RepID=UPI0025CC91AB|nr:MULTISPECIES: tyrosine-type recombinase/integrase [unclassified Microcoleus]
MYAKNKAQAACDVKVTIDRGSIRLSFPKRHTPLWELMDGKSRKGKPKYLYLGKAGFSASDPTDVRRAELIAAQMEDDLDHPEWEKLFDRTLEKYGLAGLLGGKYAKLADVLQLPGVVQAQPEITVGTMWEAYLEWKRTVIEETTFKVTYEKHFSNAIKSLLYLSLDNAQQIKTMVAEISVSKKSQLLNELSRAFDFCKSKGTLVNPTTENPFVLDKYNTPTITTQQKYASRIVNGEEKEWHEIRDEKTLEDDRRAFTKDERDIIIKAFYESRRVNRRALAPLIEFYFLTGCRTGEALALTWNDVDLDRGIIRFSKSLGISTKKVKETKTGETRLFYFSNKSRLKNLLSGIKATSKFGLVFANTEGNHMLQAIIGNVWRGSHSSKMVDGTKVNHFYPGIVTRLAEQGLISKYLPQYHTRHTYITLTAHANAHNNNALLHIATACGNSVDVILRHYLGVSESVELTEV